MTETIVRTPYVKNPIVISTALDEMAGAIPSLTSLVTSTAIGTAKLVLYYPFVLYNPVTVVEFLWFNGATSAGHIQMGVYDEAFALLGANVTTTLQGTVSTAQTVAPTANFNLKAPARYYLALTSDDATSTFSANTALAAGTCGGLGIMSETTSAFGLTNPGVPAVSATELIVLCAASGSATT